jgi:hypothetical protein
MFTSEVRRVVRNLALFAAAGAMIAAAPCVRAQSGAITQESAPSADALPAAVTPSISAKVVPFTTPFALNAQSYTRIAIPKADAIRPLRPIDAERMPSRHRWLMLTVASHSAASFDAYTTRRSVESGNLETNPFLRPFAGSPAIYVAIQASPLVMDFAAYKMQRSDNSVLRHLWWLPQSAGTALSLISSAYNLSISR